MNRSCVWICTLTAATANYGGGRARLLVARVRRAALRACRRRARAARTGTRPEKIRAALAVQLLRQFLQPVGDPPERPAAGAPAALGGAQRARAPRLLRAALPLVVAAGRGGTAASATLKLSPNNTTRRAPKMATMRLRPLFAIKRMRRHDPIPIARLLVASLAHRLSHDLLVRARAGGGGLHRACAEPGRQQLDPAVLPGGRRACPAPSSSA